MYFNLSITIVPFYNFCLLGKEAHRAEPQSQQSDSNVIYILIEPNIWGTDEGERLWFESFFHVQSR